MSEENVSETDRRSRLGKGLYTATRTIINHLCRHDIEKGDQFNLDEDVLPFLASVSKRKAYDVLLILEGCGVLSKGEGAGDYEWNGLDFTHRRLLVDLIAIANPVELLLREIVVPPGGHLPDSACRLLELTRTYILCVLKGQLAPTRGTKAVRDCIREYAQAHNFEFLDATHTFRRLYDVVNVLDALEFFGPANVSDKNQMMLKRMAKEQGHVEPLLASPANNKKKFVKKWGYSTRHAVSAVPDDEKKKNKKTKKSKDEEDADRKEPVEGARRSERQAKRKYVCMRIRDEKEPTGKRRLFDRVYVEDLLKPETPKPDSPTKSGKTNPVPQKPDSPDSKRSRIYKRIYAPPSSDSESTAPGQRPAKAPRWEHVTGARAPVTTEEPALAAGLSETASDDTIPFSLADFGELGSYLQPTKFLDVGFPMDIAPLEELEIF